MSINATFSERLQYIRTKRNLTQAKVADDLKVSRQSIGYYEKGERIPDIETASKIAQYFNVSIDYLVGLENNISSENVNISEVTGLSDEAIEVLKFIKRHAPTDPEFFTVNFLNFILEQETPPPILDWDIMDDLPNYEEQEKYFNIHCEERHIWRMNHQPILRYIYNYLKTKSSNEKIYIGKDGNIFFEPDIQSDDEGYAIYDGTSTKNNKAIMDDFFKKFMDAKDITQKKLIDYVLLYDIQDQLKKVKELWSKKQGESDGEHT